MSATIITEEEINNPTADLAADNDEVEEKDSTTLEFACVVCGSEFKNRRALSTHQGKMHKGIPQLDGQSDDLKNLLTFSFISEYGKYDVEYTIDELFPDSFNAKLVSREKLKNQKNANHICILTLEAASDELFTWPEMNTTQNEVITKIKSIPSC